MSAPRTFTVEPRGPFSLAAAARFVAGWPPARGVAAGQEPAAGGEVAVVRLAFAVDDWSGHAGVVLQQEPGPLASQPGPLASQPGPLASQPGTAPRLVIGEIVSAPPGPGSLARVREQALRILSLDHDGHGFAELGARDPVIGERQRATEHLRPVLFHSPYEAACWAVLSARTHWARAARLRALLGERLDVADRPLEIFPPPQQLLDAGRRLTDRAGLSAEKAERLHGIARAALAGALDVDRLRALGPDHAAAELRRLRGIGPFWADAIVLRAVGPADALTLHEPRLRAAAAAAYGRPEVEADDAAFTALAEGWRPYRTWVSLLLRATAAPPGSPGSGG